MNQLQIQRGSIEKLGRVSPAFLVGADWMQDQIIQKAREWLKNNWRNYVDQDRDGMIRFSGWSNDFIAAMYESTESKE